MGKQDREFTNLVHGNLHGGTNERWVMMGMPDWLRQLVGQSELIGFSWLEKQP